MKNIHEVLREKETEVEKLTREIKLLRVAVRILEDEDQPGRPVDPAPRQVDAAVVNLEEPLLEVLPVPGTSSGNGDASASKRWP